MSLATARAPFPGVSLGYQYIENIAPSWYQALNLAFGGSSFASAILPPAAGSATPPVKYIDP